MTNKSKLIFLAGLAIMSLCKSVVGELYSAPLVWLNGSAVAIKCLTEGNDSDTTTYSLTYDYKNLAAHAVNKENKEESYQYFLRVVDSENRKNSPLVIKIKLITSSRHYYETAELEGFDLDVEKINALGEKELKGAMDRTLKAMQQLVQETTAGANKGWYNLATGGIREATNQYRQNVDYGPVPVSFVTGLARAATDIAHAAYSKATGVDPGVASSQAMLKNISETLKTKMPAGIEAKRAEIIREAVKSLIPSEKQA